MNLRSLFGRKGVPSWWPGRSSDWFNFEADLHKFFGGTGQSYQMFPEEGYVGASESHQFGLDNLSRKWCNAPGPERYDVLKFHFETILKNFRDVEREIPVEELRDRLRVRIYPTNYFPEGHAENSITQEYSPQTMKIVMVDGEHASSTLQRTKFEETGWSEADLWETALKNTFEKEHFVVERQPVKGAPPVNIIAGSIYATTALLSLDPHLLPRPENPVIATIPSRNVLIWQEMPPSQLSKLMLALGKVTMDIFDSDEGPISPEYFEWKDGEVTCLGSFGRS
ncbi:MAG: hypothetical protein ABL949_09155 [Fimbriimonadaceae bacterium]